MAKLIAKTYGEALYELALEEQRVDLFFKETEMVLEILKQNSDFGRFMTHPQISNEEKIVLIEKAFRRRISDEMTGFLSVMAEKGRFAVLEEALTYFVDKVKAAKQIGVAFVTTAVALDKKARAKIKTRLLETTGFEEMEIHYTVEPAILAGVVIRIGDRVIDSSVATKLKELKRQLLGSQLG